MASFFILWLLFRLDFINSLLAWLLSGLAYVLGTGVAFVLLIAGLIGIGRAYAAVTHTHGSNGSLFAGDAAAREKSASNLRQIGLAMEMYSNSDRRGRFPVSFDALVSPNDLSASTLTSPIAHASFGPDMVYRYVDGLDNRIVPEYVIAYDAGALEQGEGTNVLGVVRGDTQATWVPKDQFDDVIAAGDRARNDAIAAEAAQRAHDIAAAEQQRKAMEEEELRRALAAQPSVAYVPPPRQEPIAPPVPAPPPPPAEPVIPDNAWTAQPDPAPVLPKIRPTLRQIFPKHAEELLYPTQASNYICTGDAFDGNGTKPTDNHDAWNLATLGHTGHIVGQLTLKDPVMSPDGQFLAGRVTGGQGQATTFEVWSFKTGKRVQSLADAPMKQAGLPIPIGFLGNDQLLTLDDGLRGWNIKSGTLTTQVDGDIKRGPNDLIAVSATGKLVAIFDEDQKLTLIDTVAGKSLGQTPIHASANGPRFSHHRGSGLAFSPDGNSLALLLDSFDHRLLVWSVDKGAILGDLTLPAPAGFAGFNRKAQPLAWLPDGDGWLIQGSQIIDRASGVLLYDVPEHREEMAQEYGPRRVLDASHILMSFKSFNKGIGLESFPLPADTIAKARAAARPSQ